MTLGASEKPPTIAIIGSGALGGYLGARLAHAGNDVRFLVRSDFDALKSHGLTVDLADAAPIVIEQPRIYRRTAEIGPVDLILIALKSTGNHVLPQLLPPLVGPHTNFLTVQNGLGNVEPLQALYPENAVAAGLCQIGVNRTAPGQIVNYVPGGGFIQIGAVEQAPAELVPQLSSLLDSAGIRVRQVESLGEALWRKLMWNVPYNGLTITAGGVSTEHITGDPVLNRRTEELMEELRAASGALGFPIESDYTPKLIEFTRRLQAYRPSSLIDWEAGRPIEVEAIWGEPLRQGEAAGVSMPALRSLYEALKRINDSQAAT